MIDLIVSGGTIVTMDPQRRIIESGAVAIDKDRICDVGTAQEIAARYQATRVLNAHRMIVSPGLIDAHGHGGHGLLKTIASDTPSLWGRVVTQVYFHFTTPEFWAAEGRLSALERLKFGVTTGLCVMGSEPRADEPALIAEHAAAYAEAGLREIVAVGPCNPPWPRPVSVWRDGVRHQREVTFEETLRGAEAVIGAWHQAAGGRIQVRLTPFLIVPSLDSSGPTPFDKATGLTEFDREQSRRVREVARHHSVAIHSDAFGGMIRLAATDPNGLLGPDVLLQHCTGLSMEEVRILADTGTSVGHAPLSGSLVKARCPVIELIEAGVTVAIVSDGTAPRTSFDLFPAMRTAIRLQQIHSQDMSALPTGKALEMVTIDAARALGLDSEIGSLEVGKKADLILVNAWQPHLAPSFMAAHRLVHEVAGQDVDTVIVDGRVLMENRRPLLVDEDAILTEAEVQARSVISRAGLVPFMVEPQRFWGSAFCRIDDSRAGSLPH